ncbi:MORC family CW-type zinc finger protein [Marchantia polymorpha subsp. ruderalis]|nr:hypothetical protein MARPO_0002s0070 [Marchantia polymorpha]BBN00313.1 hypothetical protein Mp_1g28080 [Marchantia polymorpha subsp. ruderalis]|eukprot:PTQ49571.1 hypothetical protein MARPO_0002s0070 [Marchantia polymorpha]
MDFSLRAYVSILYKVPRMQIFIRDKKVKTKRIAGLLSQKETESYKPYGVAESIKIELGFNTENKNLYGMMLYHRNRLIKAYMRVGMQLEENERGMGVIGLAEADFLQPTHNKQDFDDTTAYRRLLKKLSDVLAEYWWEKKERANILQMQPETRKRGPAGSHAEDVPDVNWVQCDNPTCLKWRVLPPGTAVEKLPDIWYCEYHPDPKFRRHEEPEQEWDTTIQHEIVERRRERKREYDREKKEREAEKKRQRLEAATRDSVAVLEKQKEELAKGIQEQLEREREALEEQKRREEEVKKLNEEWAIIKQDCALMESRREEMLKQQKELEDQLAAAQEELARKAREKEEIAMVQAAKDAAKQAEKEAELAAELAAEKARLEQQLQVQVLVPEENGHVVETTIEETTTPSTGRKPSRRGASLKEKRGTSKGGAPVLPPPTAPIVPVSTPRVPHPLPEPNQMAQTLEANGSHKADSSTLLRVSSGSGSSIAQRPKHVQVPLPHRKSAASSKDDTIARAPSGTAQQVQRKGTNSNVSTGSRRQGRTAHASQAPLLEWGPTGDLPNPVQREGMSNGATPLLASENAQCLSPEPQYTTQDKSPENTCSSHQQTHVEVHPSRVNERLSAPSDAAHQSTVTPDSHDNGCRISTGVQVVITNTLDEAAQQVVIPHADTSVRSGGQEGQLEDNVLESGRLCIDLPMDSSIFKSESMRSLDKEFFSSQRRLRLALNTLTKIGGLNDGKVYDLDLLPITDDEVIEICEKTQENVEAKLTKYRQDVASLKAELAYLMADKYQHGQGQSWNFKIQSVINKWGVMEVSKKT